MRNEIAMFILAGLVTLPRWNLVSSGIADDVVILLVGIETGSARILSENVEFGRTNEDMFLQKILLLIVTHLTRNDACVALMVKRKLMYTILQLVNPDVENIKWSKSQHFHLSKYALNTLCRLAVRVPKEFVRYKGTIRSCKIVESCVNMKCDTEYVINCIRSICTIIIKSDQTLLKNFRDAGITRSLMKLISCLLKAGKLTMYLQRMITLLLISVEILMTKEPSFQENSAEQNTKFAMELLYRCLYQKKDEFQIDQRLLLGIGSYIWRCIVNCPMSLEKFIDCAGIYVILDVIEIAPYHTRCLFLGVLTDMCDNYFCGPYLCTWRGADKERGLMSLLATVWREEEIRIGVKRHSDGSMEDVELPQMGIKQWSDTYHAQLTGNVSPTINDVIGSVRSKIYSVRKIIERDSDKYEIAKEHYKILLSDLPVEDRITMSCVDLYFRLKIGQIWIEIAKYLEHVGVTPLSMDGQVMFLMIQRHRSWGMFIQERQRKIALSIKDAEEMEEKDEYAKLRDAKLAPTLDAFDELDYIYRTSDRSYMLDKKDKQRKEIDSALYFPADADDDHCHRTFQGKINVTTIFDQHCTISNRRVVDVNYESNVSTLSSSNSNI